MKEKLQRPIVVVLAGWRRQYVIKRLKNHVAILSASFEHRNDGEKIFTWEECPKLSAFTPPNETSSMKFEGNPHVLPVEEDKKTIDASQLSSFLDRYLAPQSIVNELYQTLDVYPMTSRFEGGPQALLECGALGIPMVSRPVGMAECVLPATAIDLDVSLASPSVPIVEHLRTPGGYEPFIRILREAAGK